MADKCCNGDQDKAYRIGMELVHVRCAVCKMSRMQTMIDPLGSVWSACPTCRTAVPALMLPEILVEQANRESKEG